jgi:hypothetical protein
MLLNLTGLLPATDAEVTDVVRLRATDPSETGKAGARAGPKATDGVNYSAADRDLGVY